MRELSKRIGSCNAQRLAAAGPAKPRAKEPSARQRAVEYAKANVPKPELLKQRSSLKQRGSSAPAATGGSSSGNAQASYCHVLSSLVHTLPISACWTQLKLLTFQQCQTRAVYWGEWQLVASTDWSQRSRMGTVGLCGYATVFLGDDMAAGVALYSHHTPALCAVCRLGRTESSSIAAAWTSYSSSMTCMRSR